MFQEQTLSGAPGDVTQYIDELMKEIERIDALPK